jgi:hypothetical protein
VSQEVSVEVSKDALVEAFEVVLEEASKEVFKA